MRKKLIALLLVFALAINPAFCHAQATLWKLIVGIGLAGAGTFMAIDGFGTKEVIDKEWDERVVDWVEDISNPQIDVSDWYWIAEYLPLYDEWWAHPYGVVENTGNVPLEFVKIGYKFTDASDNYITGNYSYLDIYWEELPVGYTDSWWGICDCGSVEPIWGYADVIDYGYDPLLKSHYKIVHHVTYKKETKSAVEGAIGIAAIAGGGYLIVDYLLEQSKLKEKAGIEAKVVRKGNTSYLLACKKF